MIIDIIEKTKCKITRTTVDEPDINKKPCKKAYWDNNDWYVNIESISELIDLVDESGEAIVFHIVPDHSAPPDVEIYDDYREPFSCICTQCGKAISSKELVVGFNFELRHTCC